MQNNSANSLAGYRTAGSPGSTNPDFPGRRRRREGEGRKGAGKWLPHPWGSFSSLSSHSVETLRCFTGEPPPSTGDRCFMQEPPPSTPAAGASPAALPPRVPGLKQHTWVVASLLFSGSCNLKGGTKQVRLTECSVASSLAMEQLGGVQMQNKVLAAAPSRMSLHQ